VSSAAIDLQLEQSRALTTVLQRDAKSDTPADPKAPSKVCSLVLIMSDTALVTGKHSSQSVFHINHA